MPHTVVYFHRLQFPSESGQTIQVLRDYHALSGNSWNVHLIYRGSGQCDATQEAAALRDYGLAPQLGFHLHALPEGAGGKARLRELVRRLVAEGAGGPVFLVARTMDHALAALALRQKIGRSMVRVILELHETAIPHVTYREQGRRLRAWISRFVERHVFRTLDGIVCTVASQIEILDRLHPVHAPVAILPNGVPGEWLSVQPPPRRRDDGKFRLGYAGQFNAWKNVSIIIETLRYLPSNVVLDIAGGRTDDEAQTRETLRRLAIVSGVAERVRYVGFLLPRDVRSFLADKDVLLLPLGDNAQSRYFTSPMKLFEYAASGVPMVVTRQPTTESLVEDGVQALMCEPGSASAMAECIGRLVASPELAGAMAERARTWVAQHAYDRRAERLAKFLDKLEAA